MSIMPYGILLNQRIKYRPHLAVVECLEWEFEIMNFNRWFQLTSATWISPSLTMFFASYPRHQVLQGRIWGAISSTAIESARRAHRGRQQGGKNMTYDQHETLASRHAEVYLFLRQSRESKARRNIPRMDGVDWIISWFLNGGFFVQLHLRAP
ncbi:hypothetical protein B0J17DRAFT_631043 [Rhizoctonia solani]|nr:hypothetical protein B0J17DRAFT_631043 [Rhizoctonia solani]